MKKKILTGWMVLGCILLMATASHASLIAHWGFDETGGTTAFEDVGNVNGALVGGASFTPDGILGGAVQITNGYVDMGDNFPSTATFSVQAWVKTAPDDTSGMVPLAKHWSTIPQGYFLAINNVGDGFTQTSTAGFYSANDFYYQTAVGGPSVNDGSWHQLVGVYDNGVTNIYIDGNLAGVGSAGYADNAAHFMVGGFFNNEGTAINSYNGFIDEVGIYDNALTASEIKQLYESAINPVPIPAAFFLLSSGIAFLAGMRRVSRRRLG